MRSATHGTRPACILDDRLLILSKACLRNILLTSMPETGCQVSTVPTRPRWLLALPRRHRVWTALRQARRTGIRVPVPVDALHGRLASLPAGVLVSRDRIEVRVTSAKDAVTKLFALAQALTNDYDRFETLIEEGEVSE